MIPRKLKYRILFWFITIISTVVILFSILLYFILETTINKEVHKRLSNQAIYIHEHILDKEEKLKNIKKHVHFDVEILIRKEEEIIQKTKGFSFDNIESLYDLEKPFKIIEKDNFIEDAVYIKKISEPFNGVVLILKKNVHLEAEKIKEILWILNPILLLFILFISYKFIDKIFISIRDVSRVAKDISITNFSKTIPLPKDDDDDEIKELIESFNNMIERLKKGIDNLDRFNSDVSHELKTPLTVIRGEVEVTLKNKRSSKEYINSLKTILFETMQLEEIVENLLLLTKYSKESIQETFNTCNLDGLLLDVIYKYKRDLTKKSISLNISQLENIVYKGNCQLLSSIFLNLLDNAIKYSEVNTNITIELYKDENIHFIIKDEGIGIPKSELENILDRFYRVEKSRNKKIKGFGLGLSIVKNGVELHSGELEIFSIENKGTTIHIVL
ncbi:cell wall metabolism sensor histidine kinase WalK [Arcobacter sp. LA11]|uniref:sensor histidine kinase n=1 Tax=Arcobacter sp. LA11 TaxID=1898176 RepID=UPI000934106A|nr:HAMP domain-containing sensor histidine kinase [Arcobacter sp. LA11]